MVDPILVGGAAAVAGVAIAAGYAYLTGDDAEAGVDVDGDGESDVSYTFEGNDAECEDTHADVEQQADPTPEVVAEKDDLTDITGIGGTRAEDLEDAWLMTPEDLYYASDENLTDVDGIGSYTVEQIRGDIGSVEAEGNGESTETSQADAESDSATESTVDEESSSKDADEQ